MAKKYHVKPDGNAAPCRAFVKCPFGDADDRASHYPQEDWARKAFELQMEREAANDTAPRPASLANYSQEDREALVGTYLYDHPSYEGYGNVVQLKQDTEGLYAHDSYVKPDRFESDKPYFNMYVLTEEELAPAMPMAQFNEALLEAAQPFLKPRNHTERALHYLAPLHMDFDFATRTWPTADAVHRELDWYRTKGVDFTRQYLANAPDADDFDKKYWDEEAEKTGAIPYPLSSSLPRIASAIKYARDKGLIDEFQAVLQLRHAATYVKDREDSHLTDVHFARQPLLAKRAEEQVWLDDLRDGSIHRAPHEAAAAKLDSELDRLQHRWNHAKAVQEEADAVLKATRTAAYEVGRKSLE